MERFGSIYKITNKSNGLVYIGQTIFSVEQRWKTHINKYVSNSYINKAIKKYGKNNFTFEEIMSCFSRESLNFYEDYFVKYFNCLSPNGYNLVAGGHSVNFSEEVRYKMRMAKLGKKRIKKDNQSGSTDNKKSEHAQRLEGEPVNTEYNPSTSPQYPSKYLNQKKLIIELYLKYNSSYKVAEELKLDKSMVGSWLKTWGYLNTQAQSASIRNKKRYTLEPAVIEKITKCYEVTSNMAKVACILNISEKTVARALKG